MLRVKVDSKQVNKILGNTVKYSYGFLEGIDMEEIVFNQRLAEYTVDVLNKYIDSNARMNPSAFHHIYEWNQVGQESARLFKLTPKVSKRIITITGNFLKSKSPNDDGYVFYNKAEIMENGISLTIEPKNSEVLVFEDNGETVFTANSVYVAHPGGEAVEGSFAQIVEEFFASYFTNAFLAPLLKDLATPDEYERMFSAGARGGGNRIGIVAGKKYLDMSILGVIE